MLYWVPLRLHIAFIKSTFALNTELRSQEIQLHVILDSTFLEIFSSS